MEKGEYIKVGGLHRLYVERIGTLEGVDIVFIHGGPGLGFKEKDKQFFDFEKSNVLFYDQRGAGKSVPEGEVLENETEALVEDLNLLITHFKLKDVILFGGSWGATLALAFAIKYPENIKGIILRGLFMASKEERNYFEKGAVQKDFPEVWKRLKSNVNTEKEEEVLEEYFYKILNNKERQHKLSFELALYSASINNPQRRIKELIKAVSEGEHLSKTKIISHYSVNNFFMEDKWIERNLEKIKNIPIKIIHGVNDHVTRIQFAERVAWNHENIELIKTNDGHSPFENENLKALKKEVEKFF